jgi:molybdopterin molybdotransferase
MLWRLGGEGAREPWPARRRARLARALPSLAGREDYQRVRLTPEGAAEPVPGGSATVSNLVKADGYVVIQADSLGARAGEEVDVYLFD